MKKLMMILMAFCLTMPVAVNAQSKMVKKMVKDKVKDYKKRGYEIFGSSLTLDVALTKHYTKIEENGEKVQEIPGFAHAKSRNLAATQAQNSAATRYSTQASAQVKGRMVADMSNEISENPTEFEKFYAAYQTKVEQEIRGELRPSFMVKKENADGSIDVEAYYLVDEDAASRARIQAFRNTQNESEVAQKYAQRVSDFINEKVTATE